MTKLGIRLLWRDQFTPGFDFWKYVEMLILSQEAKMLRETAPAMV